MENMKHLGRWLKKNFWTYLPYLVIFVFWLAVVIFNYRSGTWLMGYDSVMPEFDLGYNLQVALNSAWQEFQGLGLLAGMAHGTDLGRILILFLFSWLPLNLIRYAWHFSMLLLGAWGAIKLARFFIAPFFVKKNSSNIAETTSPNSLTKKQAILSALIGLASGSFYLFNLATAQMFYIPLETFSAFYAFLPWLLWLALSFLDSPNWKKALGFILLSFFGASAFYVQTFFVTFIMILAIFMVQKIITRGWLGLRNCFFLGLLIIVSNFYWLAPVGYFTVTGNEQTVDSKQNLFSTQEMLLMNQEFGELKNIALLRGYWHEYTVSSFEGGETEYFMPMWRGHLFNPVIQIFGYILFGLACLGIISLFWQKKIKYRGALIVGFILCLLMMTGGTGVLGWPFAFLADKIPLFGQIFRVPFTKWSSATSLFYALGTSFSILAIYQLASRLKTKKKALLLGIGIFVIVLSGLEIALCWPIFRKQLFNDHVQVSLPQSYLELFDFLKTQPVEQRIAHFPVYDIWGWQYNVWGYEGSGFLWYGIQQPLLDRNFDNWSHANETFYQQIAYALNQNDQELFGRVLKQYNVSLILFDDSIFSPSNPENNLFKERSLEMLSQLGAQEIWQAENLKILKLPFANESFLKLGSHLPQINTTQTNHFFDVASAQYPYYFTDLASTQTDLPFAFLNQEDISSYVTYEPQKITLTNPRQSVTAGQKLTIPALTFEEQPLTLQFEASISDSIFTLSFAPQIDLTLNGEHLYSLAQAQTQAFQLPEWSHDLTAGSQLYLLIGEQQFLFDPHSDNSYLDTLDLIAGRQETVRIFSDQYLYRDEAGQLAIDEEHVAIYDGLTDEWWHNLTKPQELTVPATGQLALVISDPVISVVDPKLFLDKEPVNCDSLDRGQVTVVQNETVQEINFTSSDRAALCSGEHLDFSKSSLSYLMRMQGVHYNGRSLKIFVQNQNQPLPVLNYSLPVELGVYDRTYSLPASVYKTEPVAQVLNLENRSFGSETSNSLSAVNFYQLPLEQLSNIQTDFSSQINEDAQIVNITDHDKQGTATYKFTTTLTELQNYNYVILDQQYDRNWQAFLTTADGQRQPLPHYQFNGWANLWQLSDTDLSGQSESSPITIEITFWPQSLVWWGLGVLGLGGLFCLLMSIITTSRPSPDHQHSQARS